MAFICLFLRNSPGGLSSLRNFHVTKSNMLKTEIPNVENKSVKNSTKPNFGPKNTEMLGAVSAVVITIVRFIPAVYLRLGM